MARTENALHYIVCICRYLHGNQLPEMISLLFLLKPICFITNETEISLRTKIFLGIYV